MTAAGLDPEFVVRPEAAWFRSYSRDRVILLGPEMLVELLRQVIPFTFYRPTPWRLPPDQLLRIPTLPNDHFTAGQNYGDYLLVDW